VAQPRVVGDITFWYQIHWFNIGLVWARDQHEIDVCIKYWCCAVQSYFAQKTIGVQYRV
jgi:hypothetical protein